MNKFCLGVDPWQTGLGTVDTRSALGVECLSSTRVGLLPSKAEAMKAFVYSED